MSRAHLASGLPDGWRLARFGEFLRRIERKIILDDSTTYSCAGVRWYGMGAFVRERLLGFNIARKQQWIVKQGDVLYNKLFAWKGSFAIADGLVDSCIASDKFPTYEADLALIDPRFLQYFFRTVQLAKQAQDLSKGAAAISKLTLNPPQFWDLTIPLPQLSEQHQIVARIEQLATRVEEARGLMLSAASDAEALASAAAGEAFRDRQGAVISLDELVGRANLRNGISLKPSPGPSDVRSLRLSALRSGRIDCSDTKSVPITRQEAEPYAVHPGDVLVVRGNGSKELVGRAGVVEGDADGVIFPDLFIRVPLDHSRVLPLYFVAWWNSPNMREMIEEAAKTTSGIWKINQGHMASFPIPLPCLSEQRRIVTYLCGLQTKVDALKRLQVDATAKLNALLPAILDRAFKGELL